MLYEVITPLDFVLPTGNGKAYGDFVLDSASRSYLIDHLNDFEDALTRGAIWITLFVQLRIMYAIRSYYVFWE